MGGNALILRRREVSITSGEITKGNPPKFVEMGGDGGSCLRLRLDTEGVVEYWLDAGAWGVGYEFRDGKMFSVHSYVSSVNGIELTPCSEKKWREFNGHYAPQNP